MRFTLFPPQDNVIVASGRRGLSMPVGGIAARAANSFRSVVGAARSSAVSAFVWRSRGGAEHLALPRERKRRRISLLHRLDGRLGAAVGQLLFDLRSVFLRQAFLDRLGRAFDQILGFLQAEARDLANDLDDVDLLRGIEAFEDDAKL